MCLNKPLKEVEKFSFLCVKCGLEIKKIGREKKRFMNRQILLDFLKVIGDYRFAILRNRGNSTRGC